MHGAGPCQERLFPAVPATKAKALRPSTRASPGALFLCGPKAQQPAWTLDRIGPGTASEWLSQAAIIQPKQTGPAAPGWAGAQAHGKQGLRSGDVPTMAPPAPTNPTAARLSGSQPGPFRSWLTGPVRLAPIWGGAGRWAGTRPRLARRQPAAGPIPTKFPVSNPWWSPDGRMVFDNKRT